MMNSNKLSAELKEAFIEMGKAAEWQGKVLREFGEGKYEWRGMLPTIGGELQEMGRRLASYCVAEKIFDEEQC